MEVPVTRRLVVLLVSLSSLAACGPRVEVHGERSTIATFGRYSTYAWATGALAARSPREAEASLVDWRIRNAVDRGLTAKGYLRTEGGASLLVDYNVATEERDADTFLGYFRYRQMGGARDMGDAYVRGYQEGTLVLYLTDARTRELAYRASAAGVIDEAGDKGRLEDAVSRMLADLPAASAR
jgi:hypothetical protein